MQMLCMQEIFTGPYFFAEQTPRWFDLQAEGSESENDMPSNEQIHLRANQTEASEGACRFEPGVAKNAGDKTVGRCPR